MYELCCLRQSEEYGVCFDERAVEVHFFSIKKQSFFDGKTERAKAWRALFPDLKDSPVWDCFVGAAMRLSRVPSAISSVT